METCSECFTETDRWVRGWDNKIRCLTHAPNGRLGNLAHHCETCTCVGSRSGSPSDHPITEYGTTRCPRNGGIAAHIDDEDGSCSSCGERVR